MFKAKPKRVVYYRKNRVTYWIEIVGMDEKKNCRVGMFFWGLI